MHALSQVKELRDICKDLMSTCKTLSTAQQFDIESAIKLYAPWEEGATEQLHSRLQPVFDATKGTGGAAADADNDDQVLDDQVQDADAYDGCVNVRSKGGLVYIRNLRLPLALDPTVEDVKHLIVKVQEEYLKGHQVIEASAAPARCSHV